MSGVFCCFGFMMHTINIISRFKFRFSNVLATLRAQAPGRLFGRRRLQLRFLLLLSKGSDLKCPCGKTRKDPRDGPQVLGPLTLRPGEGSGFHFTKLGFEGAPNGIS